MERVVRCMCHGLLFITVFSAMAFAQKALTWQEVRDKFEAANPTLRAGQIGIDESRAQEITANLRPNPNLTVAADQIDPFNVIQLTPTGAKVRSRRPTRQASVRWRLIPIV